MEYGSLRGGKDRFAESGRRSARRKSRCISVHHGKNHIQPDVCAGTGRVGAPRFTTAERPDGHAAAAEERGGKASGAQLERRSRFADAQAYAKVVFADPMQREHYRQLGRERKCPSNAMVVANFLTPPVIEQVNLDGFQDRVGDLIRVLAHDAIEVVSVTLVVRGADAAEIGRGAASKEHGIWNHRCSPALAGRGARVEVSAENRVGGNATQTIALE